MAEKDKYSVIGVEIDGLPVADLWVKPGKEHSDATSGSLMLGNTQVATTTWGWGRGYDRAYVGTWLQNQEAAYVRRGLHGHALDYACKKTLEQLHSDRVADSKTTAQANITVPTTKATQTAITMEVVSWTSDGGATARVIIGNKVEDKYVDGITQPQALLGAVIMGLKASKAQMVTVLTRDMWLAQVWENQSFKKNLNYWGKILQLVQGRQMVVKYIGDQPVVQQQSVQPKPPIVEEDMPPMEDWDAILDYSDNKEVLPE